jgi:hypothetical protein
MVMSPPRLLPLTDCSTNYTRVLSSESAPQDEEQCNFPAKGRKKKILLMGPGRVPETRADRPTDRRSQHQLNSLTFVGFNPTRGIAVSVRLFRLYAVLFVDGRIAMGLSPVERVLPAVYRIKKL